jgi:hypothetical protein
MEMSFPNEHTTLNFITWFGLEPPTYRSEIYFNYNSEVGCNNFIYQGKIGCTLNNDSPLGLANE